MLLKIHPPNINRFKKTVYGMSTQIKTKGSFLLNLFNVIL